MIPNRWVGRANSRKNRPGSFLFYFIPAGEPVIQRVFAAKQEPRHLARATLPPFCSRLIPVSQEMLVADPHARKPGGVCGLFGVTGMA